MDRDAKLFLPAQVGKKFAFLTLNLEVNYVFIMLLLGYIVQYIALTSRISLAALAPIPPSMAEAAQIVGAGWFQRMMWIIAPLAKRGLGAGWLGGYIFHLRDAGITMMVYPPGSDTLKEVGK